LLSNVHPTICDVTLTFARPARLSWPPFFNGGQDWANQDDPWT